MLNIVANYELSNRNKRERERKGVEIEAHVLSVEKGIIPRDSKRHNWADKSNIRFEARQPFFQRMKMIRSFPVNGGALRRKWRLSRPRKSLTAYPRLERSYPPPPFPRVSSIQRYHLCSAFDDPSLPFHANPC